MSNGKKIASIAFTGAAAATTLMAAGPAFAAASWHVKNAGTGYTGTVKAALKTGTSASLKDQTTGAVLKCKKAFASGTVSKSKSGATSATLGKLKKSTTKWSSCTASTFFHFKAELTTSVNVVAKSYASGVTTGKISGNKITGVISGTNGNTCKATISGTSVPMKYLNTGHSFSIDPAKTATLTVKSATTGCLGRIAAGNSTYFHGVYHVSTPASLTIS